MPKVILGEKKGCEIVSSPTQSTDLEKLFENLHLSVTLMFTF